MGTPTSLESRLSRVKTPGEPVIVFERVFLAFGDNVILKDITFELRAGYSKIFLGASGAGKSTILKLILGLLKPQAGKIWVNGVRVDTLGESDMMKVRDDVGMVFQEGALFDSLSVRENVGYKLYEESDTPLHEVHKRVEEVLGWVELEEHIDKMPSQLSGGQRRRVAIARAMTFQPRILLYDEPTTGLDPITSITIDDEIVKLRDIEGVSSLVVTHQLRDAFWVAEKMAIRDPGRQGPDRAGHARETGADRVHHAARRADPLRGHGKPVACHQRPVPRALPELIRCHVPALSPGPSSRSASSPSWPSRSRR